tara:strand:- start:297 stop:776 length:480 start_codon:yes stop_codon:yes gene_type:complete
MTARKPDTLKKLQGTARPYRAMQGSAFTTGNPLQPAILSEKAKEIWDDLCPKLVKLGLIAEVDASTFSAYCQAYADWLEMTQHLNELGCKNWYQETGNGYRQVIPEVTERNKSFQQMQKLAPRFGLDPSARSGIDTGKTTDTSDKVEEFLFRKIEHVKG